MEYTNPIDYIASELKRLFPDVTIKGYEAPFTIDEVLEDVSVTNLIAVVPTKPSVLTSEAGSVLNISDNVTVYIKTQTARLDYIKILSDLVMAYKEKNELWELVRRIFIEDTDVNHNNKNVYYEIIYRVD